MTEQFRPEDEQKFKDIVGRVFTDPKFAQDLEQDPEQALRQAGFSLTPEQRNALRTASARTFSTQDPAAVAAIVAPVVSVLTRGTQPVVRVAVSSAVVASAQTRPTDD